MVAGLGVLASGAAVSACSMAAGAAAVVLISWGVAVVGVVA